MKNLNVRYLVLSFILLVLTGTALAITWGTKEVVCPVCRTKNKFLTPMSWGSYIYAAPSKYQFIYWPSTDSPSVYTCRKCYLSAFMWDFEELPAGRLEEVKKQLEGVKLEFPKDEAAKRFGDDAWAYTKIPMTQRLRVAEKVYSVLGEDDDFWCRFYRILGYHYEAEKNQQGADESRKKALEICTRMLGDKKNEGVRKELLCISGAMKHFLKDDNGALADFNEALKAGFQNNTLDAEKNKNANVNLNGWLEEYIKKLQGSEKPREMKSQ